MAEPDAALQFDGDGTLLFNDRLGASGIWPATASWHCLAAMQSR